MKSPLKIISDYILLRKEKRQLADLCTHFTPKYQCTKWVLLMGKSYKNYFYRCTITVSSDQLIEYFSSYDEQGQNYIRGSNVLHQRICLLDWLNNAGQELDAVTILDGGIMSFVQSHFDKLLKLDSIRIYCPDCKKALRYSEIISENAKLDSGWNKWTLTWDCGSGHRLYTRKVEAHVYTGRI